MKLTSTSKAREVEAYLREEVRKLFGDATENEAHIFSAHGYYNVDFVLPDGQQAAFKNFRKAGVPKIIKAIRSLK